MVQPLIHLVLATAALGCAWPAPVEEAPDDPFAHRAYVAWSPLPSSDGSRLAFALEPLRVDAVEHGVMVTGWRGHVADGGSVQIAVGAGAGQVLETLPRSFVRADRTADALFVWTLDAEEWTPVAPNDPPPPAGFVHVTRFDRATFAPLDSRDFSAPLVAPHAIAASVVLDTPRAGASDVARDARIVRYDLPDGAPIVLHEGRAFDAASCAREGGVTVAYQPESRPTGVVVIDVELDADGRARVARLDADELRPTTVACHRGLAGAAVAGKTRAGAPRTLVLRVEGDALRADVDVAAGAPIALSRDGATLLAQRGNGAPALFTHAGATPLADIAGAGGDAAEASLLSSGDRALVAAGDRVWTVRLDGTTPTVAPSEYPAAASASAFAGADGRFFLFSTEWDVTTSKERVARASLVDDDGVHDFAVPASSDPALAYADATRAYFILNRAGDAAAADVVTFDVASRAVVASAPFPLCDRATMLARDRCRP